MEAVEVAKAEEAVESVIITGDPLSSPNNWWSLCRTAQSATYETVKDSIIQYIQKSYTEGGHDIAESLRKMQKKDLSSERPTRKISALGDKDKAKIEQDGFDIEYNTDYTRWRERCQGIDDGLKRAYSTIYQNYCTKGMQTRVEEHPEFETKIRNDPIALLEAIQVLTHDPIRARYPWASLTEALLRFVNMKQSDNEGLLDYVKRFKQNRDVFKSHVGKHIFDEFIENSEEYRNASSDADKKKLKDEAFDQWCAYLTTQNSDQAKYGSLNKSLVSQFSMGIDQYPKTVTAATDVLSNHRFDNYRDKDKKRRGQQQQQQNTSSSNDEQSTSAGRPETSFAQTATNTVCYCCGDTRHTSHYCPKRNSTPRNEWYVNRVLAQAHMQEGQESDAEASDTDSDDDQSVQSTQSTRSNRSNRSNRRSRSSRRSEWSGLQLQQIKKPYAHLKNVLILDNGSTVPATVANPDFVENIRPSKTTLNMTTNAGEKHITLQADLPGLGTAWYDSDQITNVLGFAHLKDKYRITYDSDKEDAFLVHLPDKILKFERTPEGLYAYKPPQYFIDENRERKGYSPEPKADEDKQLVNNQITTVAENRKGFTHRQFLRAKRARDLYAQMGFPTVQNFKHILRQNLIKNCPVTPEDVDIAERIFGPDAATMKGKSTRKKPPPVRIETVEIPKEIITQYHKIRLCIDIMYVNGMPMFTGIDTTIIFRSLVPLDNEKSKELFRALDVILRQYNKAGFLISQIDCDGQFKPLMTKVEDDLNVTMNYTATDDHVPEAEHNNRTIQERIRAHYHRLPYRRVPKLLLRHISMRSTHQLNLFPAKNGVSDHFSPHLIMGGRPLDYEKDCQVPTGTYVQACNEPDPTNTNAPRTIDAIYLQPLRNVQGGHELMDLNTGRKVTRRTVTQLPITPSVIQAVETMAKKQGMKDLKITNRNGVPLYPADWIAGVDYDDENENNNNNNWRNGNRFEALADDDDDTDDDYVYDDDEEQEEYDEDFDEDEDDGFDRVDQQEIDDLFADKAIIQSSKSSSYSSCSSSSS